MPLPQIQRSPALMYFSKLIFLPSLALGFGTMDPSDPCSDEPWRCFPYPEKPSETECQARGPPTGDKYDWLDATAGAWKCSTTQDETTCLEYGCFYHADWKACMPSCLMDTTMSPGADNCFACTFDPNWVGRPSVGDAGDDFTPGSCPSECASHPEGYCGLPCNDQSDNPLNFWACYFCTGDETCGGADYCIWEPPEGEKAEEPGSCRPGCGPNACESCDWDQCSCTSGCDWNKKGGDMKDMKWGTPGSCETGCEAGNCHLCDLDETGDSSRCDGASGCVWDASSGPWSHESQRNVGECRPECGIDECWTCKKEIYGEEAEQMCRDSGCQGEIIYPPKIETAPGAS